MKILGDLGIQDYICGCHYAHTQESTVSYGAGVHNCSYGISMWVYKGGYVHMATTIQ